MVDLNLLNQIMYVPSNSIYQDSHSFIWRSMLLTLSTECCGPWQQMVLINSDVQRLL